MEQYKYRAFISYSHADEKWGDWLQRALETYRVPEALVGKMTPLGLAPRRLTPIFRDRDDLPAAGSLNKAIEEALDASLFQIVICSLQVAKSRWVNEEIKYFKRRHGQDRLLAIIVDGEPGATAIPGREAEECFPPALRFRVDADGNLTDEPAEPVAADARPDGDGRRMAVTKLAAGLIGVSLDAVVQREAGRRARRSQIFAGVSSAIAAIMIVLAGLAANARREAQAMRGHAEDLVEFMLTELRDKLEPVGKLDILKSVGDEALAYYESQDLRKLDGDALNRRAKALLLMGNIHQRRHDFDEALKAYRAAAATTGEHLRRAPSDPDRIFDYAQAVFYVGDVELFRGNVEAGAPYFEEYYRLAQRLIEIDAANPKWRLEMIYALSNLGIVEHRRTNYDAAAPYFDRSIEMRRDLASESGNDRKSLKTHAYGLSWRAVNDLARGHYRSALSTLNEQESIYKSVLDDNSEDFQVVRNLTLVYRRQGEAYFASGDIAGAKAAWANERRLAYRLLDRDAEDTLRLIYVVTAERHRAELSALEGDLAEAIEAADKSIAFARRLYAANPADFNGVGALGKSLAFRLELGGDENLHGALAAELDAQVRGAIGGNNQYDDMIAAGLAALMHYEKRRSSETRASEYAALGVSYLAPLAARQTPPTRMFVVEFLMETNRAGDAVVLAETLDRLGLKLPYYVALKKRLNLLDKK